MKKMIYSFVLVGFMLIGTSVSLLGQGEPPPRVYKGAVIMKVPANVERAALEFIETDVRAKGLDLELTGLAVNHAWWSRTPVFSVECWSASTHRLWWIWVTAAGEVWFVDSFEMVFDGYDGGMQFEKPKN